MLDVSKAFVTQGTSFPFEATVSLPAQDVLGEAVTFDEVALQGVYQVLEDAVQLEGILRTRAHGLCARCLRPTVVPLEFPFREDFRKDADEWEDETFRYEGKTVPLDRLVLTLVMLNLPMRFVCEAECAGSAEWQVWQKDISKGSCEDGPPTQRPFEALQRLLKDEEV